MILDMKKRKQYRDLEDWFECNCPVENCIDCSLNSYNNGQNYSCVEFVKQFPERTLELLEDRIVEVQSEIEMQKELEKMEMEKTKNSQMENSKAVPRLCQLLGVSPYQEFIIEGDEQGRVFAINEAGVRYVRYEEDDFDSWGVCYDEESLVELIQHPEQVVPMKESSTLKRIYQMKGLKEVLEKYLPTVQEIEEVDGKFFAVVKTLGGICNLAEINFEAWRELA